MHPDRVGLRSALLVIASLAGIAIGALAGYGCSSGASQRQEPLPVAVQHRTPRVAPMTEPPVAVQAADTAPPADPFEPRPIVPSAEPELRVRIAALRAPGASPRLTHPAGSLVMRPEAGSARTLRTPVDVRCSERGVVVTEGAGTASARGYTLPGRGAVEFRPPVGARGVVVYAETDWPGAVRVVPLPESAAAMDLVVNVPLERYLPGVLARELFKSWSPETFRAQAIAARSFAVCERAHWANVRHYDLVAGEASQAWIGEVKDARPKQAVADTRGMLLVFDERVVPAYYSSTCGGTPANAVDALTRNPHHGIAPLLAGADAGNAHRDCCRSAPRYRWEQTMKVSQALAQIRRWAGDQVVAERGSMARASAGQPAPSTASPWRTDAPLAVERMGEPVATSLRVEGQPQADDDRAADAAQSAGPGAFPLGDEIATDAPLDELSRMTGLQSIEVLAANQAGRPIRVRLIDAHGRVLDMRAEDFRRAVNYAREGEPAPRERLNSSAFRAQVVGATISFTGSGFGHGVGMCQFGAEAMAQRGASAQQILRTYYPGATVRRAY